MIFFKRSAGLILASLLAAVPSYAELIPARHKEGCLRGFLQLRDAAGKRIATGDLIQSAKGGQIVSRLVFHFRDGSLDDEVTVFTQNGSFRLVSDRHIQKGPSFPHPIDVTVDQRSGQVTTRFEKNGKTEIETDHLDLPADLANGLPLTLVKNILPSVAETKIAYLASMPKPRLVQLVIKPDGEHDFSAGGAGYRAACFRVHVELGGIIGVVAPLVGKEPADARVWVLEGAEPGFIRADVPFYDSGPLWTIEMASPVWK